MSDTVNPLLTADDDEDMVSFIDEDIGDPLDPSSWKGKQVATGMAYLVTLAYIIYTIYAISPSRWTDTKLYIHYAATSLWLIVNLAIFLRFVYKMIKTEEGLKKPVRTVAWVSVLVCFLSMGYIAFYCYYVVPKYIAKGRTPEKAESIPVRFAMGFYLYALWSMWMLSEAGK